MRQLKEENHDLLLDGPVGNFSANGFEWPLVCKMKDLRLEERSDHLQTRCDYWVLPELKVKLKELEYTPEGVENYHH